MSDNEMDEVVREFVIETSENLDQLEGDLVALEREPGSRDLLASVFRTIHTIKGATGFLGFDRLESLSHVAESLLSKLRDGELALTQERAGALLEVVDAVRGLLAAIEQTGSEDDRDLSSLIARLTRLQGPADRPDGAREEQRPADRPEGAAEEQGVAEEETVAGPTRTAGLAAPAAVAVRHDTIDLSARPAPDDGDPSLVPADVAPLEAKDALAHRSAPGPAGVSEPAEQAGHDDDAQGSGSSGDRSRAAEGARSASDLTVRVDVELLDTLMRQVGELVLTRNQIMSHVGAVEDHQLHQTVQRLSLVVSELQEGVMKTRMQPIDQLWSRLPRVVRDLAAQFSKEVVLDMEGGETELDRSLLEAVKDPLTHLVRNAIDHGIEAPEQRRAAGKPSAGVLSLRAFHEGGQVVLAVADDGGGIDPARLGAKAVERGLVTGEQLAAMSEREVLELIFRPGLSTAAVVTNVSGRGVGMDVVRTNIESIGGTVDVTSVPGEGTSFRIKIPLTLAIIPALMVGCGSERFAIPQASLLEMVQLEGEQARSGIEYIDQTAVYRLRGRLLPLIRLDEMLGYEKASSNRGSVSIVVLQADEALFGVVVDAVHESQEIVVKPLGRHVKQNPLFAGATILGDGGVALILDVLGLATAAKVHEVGDARHPRAEGAGDPASAGAAAGEDGESLVVLRVGSDRRVAVPLDAVARLEEVPADAIEQAGGRPVMQYRGDLLPLVRLVDLVGSSDAIELRGAHRLEGPDDAAGADGLSDPDAGRGGQGEPIVVYAEGGRQIGLIATEILDIVEGSFEVRRVGAGRGVVGCAVVQGRVTDLLDMHAAFSMAWGEPADRAELAGVSEEVDEHAA